MKRSFSNGSFFGEDDFMAAEIMLQLPQLIAEEKYGFGPSLSFSWGVRKRRSAIGSNPLPSHLLSSPPLLSNSCNSSKSSPKVESSSPVTPLAFSPSESDSKPMMVFNRKKMTKQEMLEIIQHLTENVRILKQELPKTMQHYEMLKRKNSILRQMSQQLSSCGKQEEQNLVSTPISITGPALEKFPFSSATEAVAEDKEKVVLMENLELGSETLESCSFKEPCELKWVSPVMSSGVGGFVMAKQLSPLGLPDLNFSAEESTGIDYSHYYELSKAALAAQARKRRIEINRYKNCAASVKPRFR